MNNTTVQALQDLYVKLGGDIADVENITTIPDMIEAVSTVAEQGASELPKVKAADNDKVLTVVNGKWNKADVPTPESDIYVLEATYENYALTFAEGEAERLVSAINAGKTVLCKIKGLTGYTTTGDILTVANIQTPFSSSWGSMIAETVATKGAGASTQIFMISFYIMCSSGTLSGTGGIWQLAQATI